MRTENMQPLFDKKVFSAYTHKKIYLHCVAPDKYQGEFVAFWFWREKLKPALSETHRRATDTCTCSVHV